MDIALSMLKVFKAYGNPEDGHFALIDISFEVRQGALAALIGPGGSGKTTLLGIASGLVPCGAGKIVAGRQTVSDFSARLLAAYRRREVGIATEHDLLDDALTVADNIELAAAVALSPLPTLTALAEVGLERQAGCMPSTLTGSERKRLCIARALAVNPRLLLLDEPLVVLDAAMKSRVLGALRAACQERGTTVLIATHDASIAAYADQVIEIQGGRIIASHNNPNPESADVGP